MAYVVPMAMLDVTIEGGRLRGVPGRNQKVSVFRGIPFARAERWRRPVPAEPWEGVRDAGHYGNVCPQRVFQPEGGTELAAAEFYAVDYPMSEDCLVANVWTPAREPGEKLPVAVYIHGGAFETGYGWLNAYDGEGFCRRGVILVTLNYRLNVFGFLALPELAAEDADGATGTYGVLDQLAGLRWVRDNIAAFGGDPGRVTVFGQSAGGMSVADLLASPLSAGLIHGAIMQSGGGIQRGTVGCPFDLDEAFATGRDFLDASGGVTLAGLRALSAEALLQRYVEFCARRPMPFQPVVDGVVIPEQPVDWFGRGRHADIPVMIGSTADEMRNLATGQDPVGDGMLAADLAWVRNQIRLGRRPSWLYHVTYAPPTAGMAHHSVEHHFVFETLNGSARPYTASDYDLALDLAGYWTNFVKTGDPNGPKFPWGSDERLTAWTPYTESSPRALLIEPGPHMGEVPMTPEREAIAEHICAGLPVVSTGSTS